MQAINDILGNDIPKALNEFRKLESKLTPHLIKLQANREQIPADLLTKFDSVMAELKANKEKLKQYGNNNSK